MLQHGPSRGKGVVDCCDWLLLAVIGCYWLLLAVIVLDVVMTVY